VKAAQDCQIRSVETALNVTAAVTGGGTDSTPARTVEKAATNGEGEGCNAKGVEGRS
jgi:hypothetical protein